MNLPNKITMLRVFLIPFFVVFMLVSAIPYSKYIALVVFVVASLTDTLDGYIARKYKLVSNFGKFMDPLADKLLVSSAMICLVPSKTSLCPFWTGIISREFIISGFRLVASDAGVVIAASWWGKIKTVVQMIMVIVLILSIHNPVVAVIEQILIYLALVLTVVSLLDYLIKNWKVMDDGKM